MIVCCGEALIDMLPRLSTLGESAYAPYAGGAIFNTAIALGRLGVPTSLLAGLSDDLMGDVLRQALKASNVDDSLCSVSSRPTTLAFVKLVNGSATYAFYDENTTGRMLSIADLPALDDSCEALHFGAISLISEPCGTAFETLLAREHASKVISLDPNIRPAFIKDKPAHMARIGRMAAQSDIIKFSDEDLAWFDMTGNEDQLAALWLACGPKLVIITKGAQGAVGYTPRNKVSVEAEKVTVVDTIGAGDTFDAGILAAFKRADLLTKPKLSTLSEAHLREALILATKAAAITVSRAGANPPFASEIGF